MNPAVFLDLQNTIATDSSSADSVTLIKGAAPAIASLRGLGYRIVVVANHEDVARGTMTEDGVQALHTRVAELVRQTANGAVIDAFYYCPFHPKGTVKDYQHDHPNRKPKPGMLTQAAAEMSLELNSSWTIGDELADIQAGHAAGTRTIMLRPDADRLRPVDPSQIDGITSEEPDDDRPVGPGFFAVDLIDAARLIAQHPRVETAEAKRSVPGRKWDAEKIAQIQVPRPSSMKAAASEPLKQSGRTFRPWGAPQPENEADDKPIVAKPFRKRQQAAAEKPEQATQAPATTQANAATQVKPEPVERDIPQTIRDAIDKKKQAEARGEAVPEGVDKTLRLILQELRSQRGGATEFSFLTIIAVALQLVAIICLLGGLFMGGADDGLFLRWISTGLFAQLIAIATLMVGR